MQVYEIKGSVYNCEQMSSGESVQEELNSTVIEKIEKIIGVKVTKEKEIEKSEGREAFVTPERSFKKRKGQRAESTGEVSKIREA